MTCALFTMSSIKSSAKQGMHAWHISSISCVCSCKEEPYGPGVHVSWVHYALIIRAHRHGGDRAAGLHPLASMGTLATWHSGPLQHMACHLSGLRGALVMFHPLFCMCSRDMHVPLRVTSSYALVVRAGAVIMLQLLVCMCGGGRWADCVVVPPGMPCCRCRVL